MSKVENCKLVLALERAVNEKDIGSLLVLVPVLLDNVRALLHDPPGPENYHAEARSEDDGTWTTMLTGSKERAIGWCMAWINHPCYRARWGRVVVNGTIVWPNDKYLTPAESEFQFHIKGKP